MQPTAEVLVDRIATVLRQRLPPGVTPAYFDGFLRRNRPVLVAVLDRQLAARLRHPFPRHGADDVVMTQLVES